jgi:hypothetical protein
MAQLMQPVVEERVVERVRGRTGEMHTRLSSRFAIEKPQVHFFSLRGGEDDIGTRYEYDPNTVATVDVAAI